MREYGAKRRVMVCTKRVRSEGRDRKYGSGGAMEAESIGRGAESTSHAAGSNEEVHGF